MPFCCVDVEAASQTPVVRKPATRTGSWFSGPEQNNERGNSLVAVERSLRDRLSRIRPSTPEIDFWAALGSQGASWLINQIDAAGGDLGRIWVIGTVLTRIPGSEEPILRALEGSPSDEVADILLSALADMPVVRQERLRRVLRRYLHHRDEAVRIRAATATSQLVVDSDARNLLLNALQCEMEEDVRYTLEDLVGQRSQD